MKHRLLALALCLLPGTALAQDKATLDTRQLLAETVTTAKPRTEYLNGTRDKLPAFVRVRDKYRQLTSQVVPVKDPVLSVPAPDPVVAVLARKALGMNLSGASWYSSRQIFTNLVRGGQWNIDWKVLTPDQLTPLGYPKVWPATGEIKRLLGAPTGGWVNQTSVACTWKGTGGVNYAGGLNIVRGDHDLSFDMPSWGGKVKNTWFGISGVDNADPFRDFECHDAKNASGTEFSSEIVASSSKYPWLRFMDWSATNSSPVLTEATRPDPRTIENPAMALENQMALAKLANANPWINISWRADTSYIRWAAKQAHDTLPRGHQLGVELSNEVWNYQFWQAQDNLAEATRLKINPNNGYGAWQNYSRRAVEVFKIFEEAFADRPQDLVRILGTQVAYLEVTRQEMSWPGVADHIDVIAGAPYFRPDPAKPWSVELARADIDRNVGFMKSTCEIARAKKASIGCWTYEGGQHVLPSSILGLEEFTAIQRSPDMGMLYGEYLAKLDAVTDVMMLFNDVDPATKYGAWGHQEYGGQVGAPKQVAVDRFLKQ